MGKGASSVWFVPLGLALILAQMGVNTFNESRVFKVLPEALQSVRGWNSG